MDLTISSTATTCALNSLSVLLICVFLKDEKVISRVGPNCIITILVLSILRFFMPFEFPWTKSIWVENILMRIREVLIYKFSVCGFGMTTWHVLISIWAIVAFYIILYQIRTYKRMIHCVSLLPKEQWPVILKKYDLDIDKCKGIEKIGLVCCRQFESPCLVGLRKPVLILPELSYGKGYFKYIVFHELMHAYKKDIFLKIFVELLCTVFWWNPVLWYLKKEFFQMIEIRNDMQVIARLSEEEKVSYMECLKDTAINYKEKGRAYGAAFSRGNFRELKRRLKLISYGTNFKVRWQILVYIIVGILLFLNSAIVIEPYSLDEVVGEGEILTSENMFLVADGDGYDVYVKGRYAMTAENLELFQDIKVYQNLEEALENE